MTVMVESIMEENIEAFLEVIKDPEYKDKAFIIKAVDSKAIEKNMDGYNFDGKLLGIKIEDVLDFFKNPKNQEIKIKINQKLNLV